MEVNASTINLLSDTTLYDEALQFLREHPQIPETCQLVGLIAFSRTWNELLTYVKHQGDRDWETRKAHYKAFYRDLQKYLNGPHEGLRQRVPTLVTALQNQDQKPSRESLDAWSQVLAQEFIQHLVAHASLQAKVGEGT
jgi:hypothetical protein